MRDPIGVAVYVMPLLFEIKPPADASITCTDISYATYLFIRKTCL